MGFIIRKPEGESGKSLPAILIGLFVAFGGILFGYVTSTLFHNFQFSRDECGGK